MDDPLGPPQKLSRDLRSGQILVSKNIDASSDVMMIGISAVVGGIIIFSTSGEILAIAGPAGVLTAFAVVGVITISVMEGLSEMIELWPVSNAMMEFVRAFIDEDLATVVGIAYWYSYASLFATLIIAAAEFTGYWDLAQVWQSFLIFVLCPVILLALNCAGVKIFGYIECVGGAIKTVFVIGSIILLFVLAGQDFEAGFQSVQGVAENSASAVCIAIPVVVYGFMGVEVIAVTAFEARNPKALRFPAKWIAYFCFLLEFFLVLGEVLTVHWKDPALHQLDQRDGTADQSQHGYVAIFVLAPLNARIQNLPGFFALRRLEDTLRANKRDTIEPRCLADEMVISARDDDTTDFCSWLGLGSIRFGILLAAVSTLQAWIQYTILWASQCLAFIRYRKWLDIHHQNLTGPHVGYNRRRRMERTDQFSSLLSYFQPAVAWLGLVGCLSIVLVFNSASWWNGDLTAKKVLVAYTAVSQEGDD
ncbi:MAG: hypothetical protein Q9180_003006 [Flavoplaca navasiana]